GAPPPRPRPEPRWPPRYGTCRPTTRRSTPRYSSPPWPPASPPWRPPSAPGFRPADPDPERMKPVGAGHIYRGRADADHRRADVRADPGPGLRPQPATTVAGPEQQLLRCWRLFTSYLPPIWGWFTLVWMRKREYL